jgi:hypothetical protein
MYLVELWSMVVTFSSFFPSATPLHARYLSYSNFWSTPNEHSPTDVLVIKRSCSVFPRAVASRTHSSRCAHPMRGVISQLNRENYRLTGAISRPSADCGSVLIEVDEPGIYYLVLVPAPTYVCITRLQFSFIRSRHISLNGLQRCT